MIREKNVLGKRERLKSISCIQNILRSYLYPEVHSGTRGDGRSGAIFCFRYVL